MTAAKESAADRADRFEECLVDVWSALQDADGSRGGLQEALDSAQDLIETEVPDVADRADTDDETSDDEE